MATKKAAAELIALAESLGHPAPDVSNMSDQQIQEATDSLLNSAQGAATSEQDKSMQPDITEQNTTGVQNKDKVEGATAGGESTRKLAPYTVASGRSITVGGEVREAGAEVTAKDFPGGDEHLQKLVEAQLVTKNEQ